MKDLGLDVESVILAQGEESVCVGGCAQGQ